MGKMFAILAVRGSENVILKCDPHLAEMLRSDGVRLYNPERSDTLLNSPAL